MPPETTPKATFANLAQSFGAENLTPEQLITRYEENMTKWMREPEQYRQLITHHTNKMITLLRSTIKEPQIRLAVDGNKWMALVGKNLQDGCGAFADTPREALRQLSEHEEFDFWAFGLYDCDECGNEFKPKDKDDHICTSCHTLTARD